MSRVFRRFSAGMNQSINQTPEREKMKNEDDLFTQESIQLFILSNGRFDSLKLEGRSSQVERCSQYIATATALRTCAAALYTPEMY